MRIILQKVTSNYPASALNYLINRLSSFQLFDFPTTEVFEEKYQRYASVDIPIVPIEAFPPLTDAEAAIVEDAIKCAKRRLGADYPLLAGEELISEVFSYLSDPFENIPAGTCAVRQQTNFAAIYFFFDDARVEGTRLRFVRNEAMVNTPFDKTPFQALPIAGALALSLAQGLISGIGSAVGALICNKIFEATGIKYFEPTAEMLKRIVHQEVTQTVINQIDGQINGTKDWVRTVYTHNKEQYVQKPDPVFLHDLQSELNRFSDNMFTQVIGPLEQDQFSKPGFAVFLIGVGLHFSLLQELALMDDRVIDHNLSPYAKSIKDLAEQHADFAQATYNKIQDDRRSMFEMRRVKVCSSAGGYPVCDEYYRWTDTYTNQSEEFYSDKKRSMKDAERDCRASMNQHIQDALVQLNKDLGDPNSVIPLWFKLVNQPVPLT